MFSFVLFCIICGFKHPRDVDFLRGASQVRAGVHAQAAGAAAETVTFWSVFAGVAVLAVQFLFVFGAVGGVQHFTAHAAFEARLVVFVTASNAFFSGIDGLFALWAFWVFNWLERHLDFFFVYLNGLVVKFGEAFRTLLYNV